MSNRYLPKIDKWLLRALAAGAAVTLGATTGCGGGSSGGNTALPFTPFAPVTTPAVAPFPSGPPTLSQVLRGRYIVTTAGCADCHSHGVDNPGDPNWLSGFTTNMTINPAGLGQFDIAGNTIFCANITTDPATGLGNVTPQAVVTALSTGLLNGDTLCPPMPWPIFANLTPDDLLATAAYLTVVKPVSNAVPNNLNTTGGVLDCSIFHQTAQIVPTYPGANEVAVTNQSGPGLPTGPATLSQVMAGRYLITAKSDCASCHSVGGNNPSDPNWLAGYVSSQTVNPAGTGRFTVGPDTTFARNLTPDPSTGIGNLSAQQLFNAIHDGADPQSGGLLAPPMPWQDFHNLTDTDTWAMVAYLQSLKPVVNTVPPDSGPVPPGHLANPAIPLPAYPAGNENNVPQ